jgi:hypothetical protein
MKTTERVSFQDYLYTYSSNSCLIRFRGPGEHLHHRGVPAGLREQAGHSIKLFFFSSHKLIQRVNSKM